MRRKKIEDGRYEVYENGRVWSFFKNGWSSPTTGGGGYVRLSYRNRGGKRCCKTLHRIVYETFNGPVPNGFEINHKDGDKTNNALKNLEIVSHVDNIRHARRLGLCWWKSGSELSFTKLTPGIIREIRELSELGWRQARIAKRFGVSQPHVHRILSGKIWCNVT